MFLLPPRFLTPCSLSLKIWVKTIARPSACSMLCSSLSLSVPLGAGSSCGQASPSLGTDGYVQVHVHLCVLTRHAKWSIALFLNDRLWSCTQPSVLLWTTTKTAIAMAVSLFAMLECWAALPPVAKAKRSIRSSLARDLKSTECSAF